MFIKNPFKDSFFDDINGHMIDKYQKKVVIDESDALLVVAGAGSGKTLTIIAKIKYLIEKKGLNPKDILCLSFTNEAVNNIKKKINYNIDVFTFHKLSLNILKQNNNYINLSRDSLLNYIVDEYFNGIIYGYKKDLLREYFHYSKRYHEILNSMEFKVLRHHILSIIKKIKCNNLQIKDIRKVKKYCFNYQEKILLFFVLDILLVYEEELHSELKIDFDDMICYAKKIIENNGVINNYKYIIIDEYQDISLIRFELIKNIIYKTRAKLVCVGDDYQAIYGFSGSNISFFLDFKKYFSNSKRIDIKNTYRNSYELISTMIPFIQKNKYQLRKNMKATFLYKNPIVLVYYDNLNETYEKLINYLYLEKVKEVMVLARYNSVFSEINTSNNSIMMISYLTVHKAKGLECENVIILKVSNDYLGFPSKISNSRIENLISSFDEEIAFPEERRLFYVALTRCTKRVYLLVPRKNPSIFIDEIKRKCVELSLN